MIRFLPGGSVECDTIEEAVAFHQRTNVPARPPTDWDTFMTKLVQPNYERQLVLARLLVEKESVTQDELVQLFQCDRNAVGPYVYKLIRLGKLCGIPMDRNLWHGRTSRDAPLTYAASGELLDGLRRLLAPRVGS